jgi:metal-responsive CopG/Arc/MetJ family transcriptional regulator
MWRIAMVTAKVKLDKELVDKAKKYAKAAGYSSTEEFISHTLESAIAQLEESESAEDLKEKLKGLGYIA